MLIVCIMGDENDQNNKPAGIMQPAAGTATTQPPAGNNSTMLPVFNGTDGSKAPNPSPAPLDSKNKNANTGNKSSNEYNGPSVPNRQPANAKEAYIAESIAGSYEYRKAVNRMLRRGGSADALEAFRGLLAKQYSDSWNNLHSTQKADYASKYAGNGTISADQAPNNSRLAAFKASQNDPIDKLSNPSNIQKANDNRQSYLNNRIMSAVQNVKNEKIAAGVDPDTNTFVGTNLNKGDSKNFSAPIEAPLSTTGSTPITNSLNSTPEQEAENKKRKDTMYPI